MAMFVMGPRMQTVIEPAGSRFSVSEQVVDAVLLLQRRDRLRHGGAVQAGRAVHVLGGHELARHRPRAAGIDRDVPPARQFHHLAGVQGRARQRHVAGRRHDAEHLQLGRGQRQQDGDRVVLAGIGVDDDLLRLAVIGGVSSGVRLER